MDDTKLDESQIDTDGHWKPFDVAYLGPEGSFSHIAAYLHVEDLEYPFGGNLKPFSSIDEVFESVAAGESACGLVPYENSIAGNITETLEAFGDFPTARIVGEVYVPVNLVLMTANKVIEPGELERIFSKYEVFGQCRKWLKEKCPEAELVPVGSTSSAAKAAKSNNRSAAIGSQMAARVFGLDVLDFDLSDKKDNFTRFLVIEGPLKDVRKGETGFPEGSDKSTIKFTTNNEPGSLMRVLKMFCDNNVNLTHIAKIPQSLRDKECVFFVDAEGVPAVEPDGISYNKQNDNLGAALMELALSDIPYDFFGSYPASVDLL